MLTAYLSIVLGIANFLQGQNATGLATAQEAPRESSTVLKVTTRLVLADAVVIDSEGRHLTNLEPQDFELLEDGVPQRVRYVSLHQPGPATSQMRESPPPGTFTNRPEFQSAAEAPTVLLLDFLNTPWAAKAEVKKRILEFVVTIPAGRSVAVYVLDNDEKLKQVCDFTSDPKKLTAAIASLQPGTNRFADSQFKNPNRSIESDTRRLTNDMAAAQYRQTAEGTAAALRALARRLSGITGRKNLVWISAAFPVGSDPTLTLGENLEALKRTAALVMGGGIAIYAVDARGMMTTEGDVGPEQGGLVTGARYASQIAVANDVRQGQEEAMRSLAKQAGGKAYYGRNDLAKVIADSIADGSVYYTLGYYPENKSWDGKYRAVEIRVKRPGVEVRSHKGYYALAPDAAGAAHEAPAADQEFLDALQPGAPVISTLPLTVQVTRSALGKTKIHYTADGSALIFEPGSGELQNGNFEFVAAVFDTGGKPVTHASMKLVGALKADAVESIRKSGLVFDQEVALSPGGYVLKLGVRDNSSGLIGTVLAEIAVPKE